MKKRFITLVLPRTPSFNLDQIYTTPSFNRHTHSTHKSPHTHNAHKFEMQVLPHALFGNHAFQVGRIHLMGDQTGASKITRKETERVKNTVRKNDELEIKNQLKIRRRNRALEKLYRI